MKLKELYKQTESQTARRAMLRVELMKKEMVEEFVEDDDASPVFRRALLRYMYGM